jgi:outer membrane cobalamin receptor
LKRLIFFTALFFPVSLGSQVLSFNDTILVKEVVINSQTGKSVPGFKIITIDSGLISDYNLKSLSDLISENSSVFIKSYGSGGLANPSLRGTGPGHTIISWNDLIINNPMLGQFDMSLVPAGFIDKVEILPGGGSMDISEGGLGGIINLESDPDWGKRTLFFLNPGIASFGSLSGLAKINTGNSGFQSVTRILINHAHNNFPYVNNIKSQDPVIERRKNNEVAQQGFIQEFYIKKGKGMFSGRFWYQSASRNLPLPISMLSMETGEKQNDRAFRSLINYKGYFNKSEISVSGAFLSDKLNYSNKLASIDSRNRSNSYIIKLVTSRNIGEQLRIKFSMDHEINIVQSNNYPSERTRNISSAFASAQFEPVEWLKARVLIREITQDMRLLKPDLSLGIDILPFQGKDYAIHAGVSRNSKVPTLNDMYWLPGGNPDLKNETGYSAEAGFEVSTKPSSRLTFRSGITGFINSIHDMIQWYPGENSSYWIAGNVNTVKTAGFETDLDFVYSGRRFNAHSHTGYTFTKASSVTAYENSSNKVDQLVYIPENQLNTMVKIYWPRFFSTVRINYISRRYTTADNLQYLPGYALTDLNLGARVNSERLDSEISFTVENIFDTSYQNIAWYPMPGRVYSLEAIIKLKL